MNKGAEIDFLIVGQGFAGSAVAMRALAHHYTVLVIDQPAGNHSSRVASGLFNPITGKNMIKTWLADEIFPVLYRYYRDVERLTRSHFFYPMPLYKPFGSAETQNEWMARTSNEVLEKYISEVCLPGRFNEKVKDPFGGIILKQTGYLDSESYLRAVRGYLEERAAFQLEDFEATKLEVARDFVRYGNVRAKRTIFCQGVGNASNPWFGDIPVLSLKGESLTVQCDLKNNVMLNGGVHMVPNARAGEWCVGSTYNRDDHSAEVTAASREQLERKLKGLVCVPYRITGQNWGIRPTTPDRKPILGAHRDYKSLIVFNGLGTKGISLAPYFSDVFIRWVENKGTINKEADVARFY